MGVEENKAAVTRALEHFNAQDDRYYDVYTDDVVAHGFPPDVPPNLDGIRAMFGGMWVAFPDLHGDLQRIVAEDDMVAIQLRVSGMHEGEFMGMAPTGKRIDIEVMAFLRFDDDAKIVERWTRMDEVAMLTQLGAMPAPAEAPA
jgi:predicted ester cyclase